MKLLLLILVASVAVVCHVRASSSFDDIAREELWELLQEEDNSKETDEFFDARALDIPKDKMHSERLRACVKCVGNERSKGKNVKQSTSFCNKVCKRSVFDTRALVYSELFDK